MSHALTEFLLARIAEDEAAALDTQWLALEYGVDSYGCEVFANRVMPECEAKRRIIETCGLIADDPTLPSTHLAQHVLTDMALPYADHPDFRQEWKMAHVRGCRNHPEYRRVARLTGNTDRGA